jgi:hypothetical protein
MDEKSTRTEVLHFGKAIAVQPERFQLDECEQILSDLVELVLVDEQSFEIPVALEETQCREFVVVGSELA